jgi:hypothetical protein
MMKGLKAIVCKAAWGLALALLAAGCADVLRGPGAGETNTGTATLRVSLGAARTVAPGIGQFEKILLSIEGVGDTEDLSDAEVVNGSATLEFPIGSWQITAKAYIDDGDPDPAAVSEPHDFSWDGANVSGDPVFILQAGGNRNGTLRYTITVPGGITLAEDGSGIRIEVDGAVYEELNTGGFVDGVHDISVDETDVAVTLPGGRYTVEILLADDSGNAAAYRESVIILPGLTTELAFAPDAADFLDPAVLAALTDVTAVNFGPTVANEGGVLVDTLAGSPAARTLAIEAPAGAETVYFTMTKTEAHSVVSESVFVETVDFAEGSSADEELVVFKVDTASTGIAKEDLVFDLAVTEEGKIGVTVAVTIAAIPGLYINTGSESAEALTPVIDENDGPVETLQTSLAWLADNAVNDTNYVILMNQDSGMNPFASKSNVTGVRITLRGIGRERKVYATSTSSDIFTINQGTTLALDKHITLGPVGGTQTISGNFYFIKVLGDLEMLPGSRISGNKTKFPLVSVSNGTFRMKGGDIRDNSMSSGNTSMISISNGAFEMEKGANIINNTLYYASTVPPNDTIANMLIEQITAAVGVSGGTFTMSGGEISDTNFRAVSLDDNGKFIMEKKEKEEKGGVIRNNGKSAISVYSGKTLYQLGGGVFVKSGSFLMSGGEISNNGQPNSVFGSGIYIATAGAEKLALTGTVTIADNTIGFYKSAAATECYPYLGSKFSSTAPIGVDLVVNNSNSSVFSAWWKGQQFLKPYSAAPPDTDDIDDLAAYFGTVKCYTKNTYLITDVSSTIKYRVGDDGKIAAQ